MEDNKPHPDADNDNNAELWHSYQTAANNLRSHSDFFTKYKAPPKQNTQAVLEPVATAASILGGSDGTVPSNAVMEPVSEEDSEDLDVEHTSNPSRPNSETIPSLSQHVHDTVLLLKEAEWEKDIVRDIGAQFPAQLDPDPKSAIRKAKVKMSDTSDSDDVVLHRRKLQRQLKSPPQSRSKVMEPQPGTDTFNSLAPESPSHWKEKTQPGKKSGMRYIEPNQETKDELKRLREEAIKQIGKPRELPPDSKPEDLIKARHGAGCDPASETYHNIIRRLEVPRTSSVFEFPPKMSKHDKTLYQWALYTDDKRTYPVVENGHVVLYPSPRSKSPSISDGSPFGDLPPCPTPQQIVDSVNWDAVNNRELSSLAKLANWNHGRWSASPDYRNFFFGWLDHTMRLCHYADIYHESFFNGTAHSDGIRGMFIPYLEYGEASINTEDEATRLHRHETADGYRFNLDAANKCEDAARKADARIKYLTAMRSPVAMFPIQPKANIYLRPAETGDVPGILSIYNWYVVNATQCVDISPITDTTMRQRIDECKNLRLPFIVAVERRFAKPTSTGRRPYQNRRNQSEPILGFASVTDFMGVNTIGRTTAEIEIWVHQEKKGQGIGRCLMDQTLQICDPMYLGKGGYFFDTDLADRGAYSSASARRLARLIVVMCYPDDDARDYNRVKKWLTTKHKFVEQGALKGTAIKFNKFLNVSYLVRPIICYEI